VTATRTASGRRRQRVAAYGIARDETGRVLLVRAASYLTVAGRWFLPGGGVEHGETPLDALRREVAEETGLSIETAALLGVASDTWPIPDGTLLHTVRLIYSIESWTGELTHEASGSSDQAAWFDPSEIAGVPLVRYAKEALRRFGGVG
jgi:8-oxo-dGTP diphosphatase